MINQLYAKFLLLSSESEKAGDTRPKYSSDETSLGPFEF